MLVYRILFIILFVLSLVLLFIIQSQNVEIYINEKNHVINFRKAPSTSSKALVKIHPGGYLFILKNEGEWLSAWYKWQNGYAHRMVINPKNIHLMNVSMNYIEFVKLFLIVLCLATGFIIHRLKKTKLRARPSAIYSYQPDQQNTCFLRDDVNKPINRYSNDKIFKSEKQNTHRMEKKESQALNVLEKGEIFENYIIHKIVKKGLFILKRKTSNYSTLNQHNELIYDESNQEPDLHFTYRPIPEDFIVECKYRSKWYNLKKNGGNLCLTNWEAKDPNKKIEYYRRYSEEKNIPIFIALGVGGTPNDPDELYSIPIGNITESNIFKKNIQSFRKHNKKTNFFFNPKNTTLT